MERSNQRYVEDTHQQQHVYSFFIFIIDVTSPQEHAQKYNFTTRVYKLTQICCFTRNVFCEHQIHRIKKTAIFRFTNVSRSVTTVNVIYKFIDYRLDKIMEFSVCFLNS